MTAKHSQATVIHRVHEWEHANAAARTGQSVTSDDLGKVSWQQDTNVLYWLSDTGPDWEGFTGGTGTQGDTGDQGDTGVQGPQGDTGVATFTALTDTPGSYTANRGQQLKTNDAGSALEFSADYEDTLNQASHTDTTWYTVLEIDIATDTAFALDVLVAGYDATNGQQWGYQFYGWAMNDSGTTTVTTGTVNALVEADAAYDARILADDGNDRVQVQVRRNGGVSYDINWAARVRVAIA